jgi:hypothetical protein
MGWGGLETTKNPEVVPGWGCWGDFYKTKISKINVDFIKKRKKIVYLFKAKERLYILNEFFKSGAV